MDYENEDPTGILRRLDAHAKECFRHQRRDVVDLLRSDARAPLAGDDLSELWTMTTGVMPPERLAELAAAAKAMEAGTATPEQHETIEDYINHGYLNRGQE